MWVCPKCRRTFHETADFDHCPYDGTQMYVELPPDSAPARPTLAMGLDLLGPLSDYDRLIGQTLDNRYLIESRLGEGGMGVVFRARHIMIEKSVAVKVLKREVARDQNVVRRFVREARAASRIGHPNIIDVTDFGVTPDGMTYQVMEFLEGETLGGLLRVNRVPVDRALPIVAQLTRALGAAHDKGIVHRDLKPENVFLLYRDGRQDFVKVVDFGIAKVTPLEGSPEDSQLTRAGLVFGTPDYMAPEQAQGRTDVDHRVDVYALGTMFYEMLVGMVPHRGETSMRTLAMKLHEPIVPPRQAAPDLVLSDALEDVVMRALARKRQHRYQSMQEMLEALVAAAVDVPLEQPLSMTGPAPFAPEPDATQEWESGVGSMDDLGILRVEAPTWVRAHQPAEDGGVAGDGGTGGARAGRERLASAHDLATLVPSSELSPVPAAARAASPPAGLARGAPPRLTEFGPLPRRWAPLAALIAVIGAVAATVALAASLIGSEDDQEARVATADEQVAASAQKPIVARVPETVGSAVESNPNLPGANVRALGPSSDAGVAPGQATPPRSDARVQGPGRDRTARGGARPRNAGSRRSEGGRGRRGAHAPASDGGKTIKENRADVEIQVMTNPPGGRLTHDGIDDGPDGTNFRRPQGTTLNLECRKYDKNLIVTARGTIRIEFDGHSWLEVCHMQPLSRKKCSPGVQSPGDDCPDK